MVFQRPAGPAGSPGRVSGVPDGRVLGETGGRRSGPADDRASDGTWRVSGAWRPSGGAVWRVSGVAGSGRSTFDRKAVGSSA
ncbi:hypothetical protein D0Q02_11465 [Micromonospora craniellae]|uniref:Uncharacterized protein n=1 Tax=Micromonospora craniellae TaxID=2294034 RepID=A0A372G0Y5_9ACTN|nr:hypothetical protein D0Q02_11465 [Micromonospora craniellae]